MKNSLKQKKSHHLRTMFAVSFGILAAFFSLALTLAVGHRATKDIQEEVGYSLSETAYQMAERLDQYMWARQGEIRLLTELEVLRMPEDVDAIQKLIDHLKNVFPSFSWVGYLDASGTVLAATNGFLVNQNIAQRPVYYEGIEGTFIGDVHEAVLLDSLLREDGNEEAMKFVDVSSAVYDESGNAIGVLAAHLSWTWADEIQSSLFASASARKNLDFFVISHSDNMILLGPDALIGQTLALDSIENARSGKNNWSIERWPDGNEYLTGYVLADGYKDYSGLAWVVLVRQPVDTAFASAEYMQYYTLILGVLLTLFFAGLGWWIAGQITESLTEITKAAKALGKGERIEIPKDKGILEIEQLSQSLDEMVYNLTHAESALSEMQSLAHHDALTGLPNRIALDMYLHNTKTRARLHGMDIAVLYLDLDGFKAVNDAWGHHYGDEVLKAIAGRLTANTRTDELVARLGGDEFVMVLYAPEEKARRVASVVAGRVIDAINRPISIQGNEMHVGCSVGIAIWTQIEDDSKTVQNNADTALYYSKRTGKNKMTFFEDIEVK